MMSKALLCSLALLVPPLAWTPAEPGANEADDVRLEVELKRGDPYTRIRVYVTNESGEDFVFENGAHGGPGEIGDSMGRHTKTGHVLGTAPTVVPQLTFRYGDGGRITVTPPTLGGPTRRAMRAHQVVVPAGERLLYADFSAPAYQVKGPFDGGFMRTPERELFCFGLSGGR